MWCIYDYAPTPISKEFLDKNNPIRCIGRGGRLLWLPRCPDVNPLDFFYRIEIFGKLNPSPKHKGCMNQNHRIISGYTILRRNFQEGQSFKIIETRRLY